MAISEELIALFNGRGEFDPAYKQTLKIHTCFKKNKVHKHIKAQNL